jgi:DNA-directed RNA polymerase specialized sigma24 family protein
MRLVHSTLPAEDSETVFDSMASTLATAEQIESTIYVRELMSQLSPDERLLCVLKKMGFSSREIARERGTTVAQVDTLFYRIKRKIRAVLRDESEADSRSRTAQPHKPRTT